MEHNSVSENNLKPQEEINSNTISNYLDIEKNSNSERVKHKTKNNLILSKFIIIVFVISTISSTLIISTPTPTPTDAITPNKISFDFNTTSTHEKINLKLSIANPPEDIGKSNYKIILTLPADANETFLNSISSSDKDSHQVSISQQTSEISFSTYLSSHGKKYLKPNTNYALNLIQENQIIKTQFVSTQDFIYIYSLEESHIKTKTEKYLKFRPKLNEEFSDYKLLYIFTTDADTLESTFTTIPKENVKESWFSQQIIPPTTTKQFIVNIYCTTDNPEKLKFENETKVIDEETIYLIYKHPNLITL